MDVPDSHRVLSYPMVLRYKLSGSFLSCTSLSLSMVIYSEIFHYPYPIPRPGPCNPLRNGGFRLFRFRSPLLTESLMISFPGVTKMFQFTPCPAKRYYPDKSKLFMFGSRVKRGGLPHSETAGSKVYGTSPTSIAAVCVLPRSKPPRHPLSTL